MSFMQKQIFLLLIVAQPLVIVSTQEKPSDEYQELSGSREELTMSEFLDLVALGIKNKHPKHQSSSSSIPSSRTAEKAVAKIRSSFTFNRK
jgi:hypothetical protein